MTKRLIDYSTDSYVIVTTFANVKLGPNAVTWLEEPKRKKDKKKRLQRLEAAAEVMAHLEWRKGGVLESIE